MSFAQLFGFVGPSLPLFQQMTPRTFTTRIGDMDFMVCLLL